jgi:hypothetical protein
MLSRNAINAAHPLAHALAGRGIVLAPHANTPLQAVVATCQPQADVLAANAPALESAQAFDVLLERSSASALPDGSVPHDAAKNDVVAAAKLAVAGNLSIARNVVNPAIKQVVDFVNKFTDDADTSLSRPMNVVPIFYKPLWDSPVLEQLAGRHRNQFSNDLVLRPITGVQAGTDEAFAAVFSVGVPSIDAELDVFAKSLDPAFVAQIWNETFGPNAQALSAVLYSPMGTPAGAYGRIDAPVIVYLSARWMLQETPAGVNMDLGTFRAYMSEVMARAGQAIMGNLTRRARDLQNGTIIVTVPRGASGDVYVLGDNYNRFLANGGSPEAIFGSIISGRAQNITPTTPPDTLAAGLLEWKRTQAIINQQIAYQRQTTMVQGLAQAVARLINDLPDDQRVVPPEVMHGLLKKQIQALPTFKQEDLWAVARSLVCGSIYPHTDAEEIITAIDAAAKANPDLDIREAALLGTIDYVVQWLVEQVQTDQLNLG